MAISRYRKIGTVRNAKEQYEEFFEPRGVKSVLQHRSVEVFEPVPAGTLNYEMRVWKQADRFWKLAQEYYQDPRYWWVIAQFNQKPTEAHLSNGDIIIIPMPLQPALASMGH